VKAAAFEHTRPESLDEAIALLANESGTARVLAGGQSLGPMLNLRLTRPLRLVQVNRLAELAGVAIDDDAVTIGACVTHAAIADGGVADSGSPDRIGNVLARVAGNIAYRAIRNRGTIGGSLCHADPAADWVTVLTALNAIAVLQSPVGERNVGVGDFVLGSFRTALLPGEILRAVRVPRLPADARWGYVKACRKPGDFAHAMAAVLLTARTRRVVIGALGRSPLLLEADAASIDGARSALQAMDGLDQVQRHMQLATVRRALAEAGA
jgi:aerobic carbon-monoxide dehydrogenase medium subunit